MVMVVETQHGQPSGSGTDGLGALNMLSPERVVEAAALVTRGVAFRLDLPLSEPSPPLFEREAMVVRVDVKAEGVGRDDVIDNFNTQSSTQWDGFRHLRHPVHGFYGGVDEAEVGIHSWGARGIVGRAVLADVARWREEQGRPLRLDESDGITMAEVQRTLDHQGSDFCPGDILLIRTGWVGWYLSQGAEKRHHLSRRSNLRTPGLIAGRETVEVLRRLRPAAIAADNPALEVYPFGATLEPERLNALRRDPNRISEWMLHADLIPVLGLPVGELFVLDALAEDSAATGRYEAMLTSVPLLLPGGCGSPANALALR